MKIAYIGMVSITDSELPLIRELQKKGIEVICYYPIVGHTYKSGLMDIGDVKKVDGIIKAEAYQAFREYKDYLNIDNIYIINNYHCRMCNWQSYVMWAKLMWHIRKQKVDLLHFVWPFRGINRLTYLLNLPKVMTVHDPIPHSSQDNTKNERERAMAFKNCQKYMLLSNAQINDFCERYYIDKKDIIVSRFGEFDWLDYLKSKVQIKENRDYILFWGQIQSHKGIDVLLKAMLEVHKIHPWIKCIIAGKGKFDFDISPYQSLDYIEFRNYYITTQELVELLYGCLFSVVPYRDATQSGVVQTAFSAGKPLIVTNVGALPEVVKDGVTGIVVPPSDPEALAKAIIELAGNIDLLNEFKQNIETTWRREMDWSSVADKYIEMYNSVLGYDNYKDTV